MSSATLASPALAQAGGDNALLKMVGKKKQKVSLNAAQTSAFWPPRQSANDNRRGKAGSWLKPICRQLGPVSARVSDGS